MTESKWIIDGHHYMCPDCKKTIAIVINESDEDFDFCPFCGKRMSGKMAENKMAEVASGLLPSGYRCKKCGSVNVEFERDTSGYYVKCENCGHYVGGKTAKEALRNWERDEDGRE